MRYGYKIVGTMLSLIALYLVLYYYTGATALLSEGAKGSVSLIQALQGRGGSKPAKPPTKRR